MLRTCTSPTVAPTPSLGSYSSRVAISATNVHPVVVASRSAPASAADNVARLLTKPLRMAAAVCTQFGSKPSLPSGAGALDWPPERKSPVRSEEHTSELQSRQYLVCRL